MSLELEVLIEAYNIMKQYVPTKDKQEAADNLMSSLVDLMEDQDIASLSAEDKYLGKAYKEYVGDEDEDFDANDDDE